MTCETTWRKSISPRKACSVSSTTSSTSPTQLIGDALRIQQVLFNLVGNAVKFTAQGNVRVQLQLLEAAQTKARIRFNIKDTGIGIAQEDQAKLFQPFSQADTSITRRFGGSGLGLAIS